MSENVNKHQRDFVDFLIGLFVISVFFQNKISYFKDSFIKLINQKILLVLLGIVHGLSNLGGSLLTTIIYSKNMGKDETRSTIVICYATLACIQLLTLLLTDQFYFQNIIIFCLIGFSTVVLTEFFVYNRINSKPYKSFFEFFLLIMGLFLIFK